MQNENDDRAAALCEVIHYLLHRISFTSLPQLFISEKVIRESNLNEAPRNIRKTWLWLSAGNQSDPRDELLGKC